MQTSENNPAASGMTDEQLGRYAMEILQRELGAAGFARFLRVYRSGSGDYTEDRHRWLDGYPLDDAIRELTPQR